MTKGRSLSGIGTSATIWWKESSPLKRTAIESEGTWLGRIERGEACSFGSRRGEFELRCS